MPNRSSKRKPRGKTKPNNSKARLDDLDGRIDAILDAGPTRIGVESTVLDVTVEPPQVLRPGGTSFEELKKRDIKN
jgi:L-threonylcarbamoyladenylate synthase